MSRNQLKIGSLMIDEANWHQIYVEEEIRFSAQQLYTKRISICLHDIVGFNDIVQMCW